MAKTVLNRSELKELIKESMRKYIKETHSNGVFWIADPEDWSVVNDESDGEPFLIKLWRGNGYALDLFLAYGYDLDEAMVHVYEYCSENGMDNLFIPREEIDRITYYVMKEDGISQEDAYEDVLNDYTPIGDGDFYYRIDNFAVKEATPEEVSNILNAHSNEVNENIKMNKRNAISKKRLMSIIRESVKRQLRESGMVSGLKNVQSEQLNDNYDETKPSNDSGNYPEYRHTFTYNGKEGVLFDTSSGSFGTRYELEYDGNWAEFGTMLDREESTFDRRKYKLFIKAVNDYFDVNVPTINDRGNYDNHSDFDDSNNFNSNNYKNVKLTESGLRVLVNKMIKEELKRRK